MPDKRANPHSTSDLSSQLAAMYKRWVLDCVVMSAFAVSKDFSQRPELYQDVDPDLAKKITDLQSRYGYDGMFPDDDQRNMLLTPIFGVSDGGPRVDESSAFCSTRASVIAAAADYSENAQPTGFPMLRERFRSVLVPFRTFLQDRGGNSLSETGRRQEFIFQVSQTVVRDENIRVVFGVNKDIDKGWPLDSTDPNGAKLIEKITQQLAEIPVGPISLDRFVRLQRVAQKGSDAIGGALRADIETDDKELDAVIANCYAWGSDLKSLKGESSTAARNKALQR